MVSRLFSYENRQTPAWTTGIARDPGRIAESVLDPELRYQDYKNSDCIADTAVTVLNTVFWVGIILDLAIIQC